MDTKERWKKYTESLQQDPIPMMDEETLRVGVPFFWRQLLLGAPAYGAYLWAAATGSLNELPGFTVVIAFVVILYALGGAEAWRTGGKVPAPSVAVFKLGFSLWWRVLAGWMRFVLPLVILAFLAGMMEFGENTLLVLALLLWAALSVPVMGFAVRQWNRMQAIEGGTWAPPTRGRTPA